MTDNKHYDIRCVCNLLLMRAYLSEGSEVAVRCPKCGKMFKYKQSEKQVEERTGESVV